MAKVNKRLQQAEALLDNPNVKMFQELISRAEGTTDNGYHTEFGGGRIDDLSKHPNKMHTFTQTNGKENKTSAAGRYQFIGSTFNNIADRLGLDDFSPRSQDLAVIELMRENKALDDVVAGNFEAAADKLGKQFASLPSSTAPQAKRGKEWLDKNLAEIRAAEGATQLAEADSGFIQNMMQVAIDATNGDATALETLAALQRANTDEQVDATIKGFPALNTPPVQALAMATDADAMVAAAQANDPVATALANLDTLQAEPVVDDTPLGSLQLLAAAPQNIVGDEATNQLLAQTIMDENDQNRRDAVNKMFRPDVAANPLMALPDQIEAMISNFLAKSV